MNAASIEPPTLGFLANVYVVTAFPGHYRMRGANTFGPASLIDLDQPPPTGAVVVAPPAKIVNGSGSPLRVIALVPD